MARSVSVIIAAVNEELLIGDSVHSAFAAGADEVIVVDGGSTDATPQMARQEGAHVIVSARMRARQFNRGAQAARGDILIFLHGDSMLPPGAADAVRRATTFGGFRIAFIEQRPNLSFAAFMINLRTALSRCPWGDQGQFIARSEFEAVGGFRDIPLMEDYDLAVRMKRRTRPSILPLPVKTSGRRFLRKGLIRTTALNWWIVLLFRLGVAPERLAKMYRR